MTAPVVEITRASLSLGGRPIWTELSLSVSAGEFLAVIGPNGAGKTSLLRMLLGMVKASGAVQVLGAPPRRGDRRIGYVPQQRSIDPDLPLRGRDLVRMGADGSSWGPGLSAPDTARRVDRVLDAVGASAYADRSVGRLSGGEQQRLRIAQALVGEPELLLCDEPLLSLDLHHQQEIIALIDGWRAERGGTVIFVTHDVNPILAMASRVLAVVGGRWALGPPGDVLTSRTMSELYGSPIDVIRVRGRVVVLSETGDPAGGHHDLLLDPPVAAEVVP